MELPIWVIITFATLLVLSVGLNFIQGVGIGFLGKELVKKFAGALKFFEGAKKLANLSKEVRWNGADEPSFVRPHMGVIVLSGHKPFAVTLGFRLVTPGWSHWFFHAINRPEWIESLDPFGWVGESRQVDGSEPHQIAIATWLGKGAVDFTALCSDPSVTARIYHGTEQAWIDGGGQIDHRCPPHPYQEHLEVYA